MTLAHRIFLSPVGALTLVASDTGLVAILWQDDDPARVRLAARAERSDHPILETVAAQLTDYFAGRLQAFTVPLDFRGTPFQQTIWAALLDIPFGETRSYGDIARAVGRPTASRAVGAANGRNPISIIAPCHRVVGANGALTGFAGGLETKRWLLDFEQNMSVMR
ncbi:methylated-DNA--[protein]-cysteine S-methyltransferase [Sphingobium sp. AR-3-1]|uniref:Methylated-DNA--protein-cysteine methyltransferase n=1 Tax=Sphingobium psychrophilum TaxID=2728834 RepID=A0A7X9WUH8_9SPHN|nr:methylated-DNA--[protein]-cysteine S-methyltransferase [Sphingobium psychrophilum]NML10171.1 methylated-DNA--[protein]-cysteine S-methyltransferase [Sphingobium psychrophilum]